MIREYARSDVIRIDAADKKETYYSEEGYLYDDPIVGRIGIQIYHNPDGTERREYRPAEEVFSRKAMDSAKGVPIIITHDAGFVNKDNAPEEEIGTVLDVFRDGDYLRAHIVIHDTDAMKDSGLKELSLGYNLDIDDTAGEYQGEHYDCIQRNIRINHLALVAEARAGDSARLNIDGKDTEAENNKEGGTSMSKVNGDNIDPKEFQKKVDEFANGPKESGPSAEKTDGEDLSTAEKVKQVRDRRDRRDEDKDPEDLESATSKIKEQDKDIQTLLDCIDSMEAEGDMATKKTDGDDTKEKNGEGAGGEGTIDASNTDGSGKNCNNMDSADQLDQRVAEVFGIGRICEKLHLDGIESMKSSLEMKKAVIRKVRPTLNLDGKSKTYINAAYDIAVSEVEGMPKNADYQRRQMLGNGMNHDSADFHPIGLTAAQAARERMIAREGGNQ